MKTLLPGDDSADARVASSGPAIAPDTVLPEPLVTEPIVPNRPGGRGALKWLLRLMLGVAIVAWLVSRPEGARAGSVLREASPWLLPMAVLAYWLGQIASARRWQLLLNTSLLAQPESRSPLGFVEYGRIYFLGMFGNLWLPTSIGGDAARAFLAGRRINNFGLAVTSVFLDRFIGFVGLIVAGASGLLWDALARSSAAPGTLNGAVPMPALRILLLATGGLILVAIVIVVVLRLAQNSRTASPQELPSRGMWSRLSGKLSGLHAALADYAVPQRRKVLWAAFGWSFVVQVIQITINIGLARAVGLTLPASTLAWLAPLLALSSVLPLGIGGLGVREAAAVALLHNSGATQSTVIAWSLLWQATVWLSSLPGGLLMLGLKGRNERL
ncbi:MAG: glycosyltransferase 2 family protein [Abditibacteriota bacterium]|nr:glycosyltransferase 2 family protein [Abditibacteriota bacterium]